MAEISTQEAGPILADDLMRDRARQFVEFLDDDVGFPSTLLVELHMAVSFLPMMQMTPIY